MVLLDRFRQALGWNVKATAAPGERLPLPRGGGGWSGWTLSRNGDVTWLHVGGKQLPIKPSDAGDLTLNPLVSICLQWIGTSWGMAVPQVGRMVGKEFKPDATRHPVLDLLQRPNSEYGGKWLFWALNNDFWTNGNAYVHMVSAGSRVMELHYLPAANVEPKPDAKGHLSHYEYTVDGQVIPIEPADIVHFRFGVDPDNLLKGRAPLRSAFREVVKDNSASDYLAGLFKRGGQPPAILSPRIGKDADGYAVVTPDEAQIVTQQLHEKMEAEPGSLRFLPTSLDYHALAFEPGKMGIEAILEEPETRIPALFQIPPEVIKVRAGLIRGNEANIKESVQMAWQGCLIPTQDYFAEELTVKLLSRYPASGGKVIRYDRSAVPELQEDVNAKREQARKDHEAGIITLEEARAEGGRETTPAILAQLDAERPAPPTLPPPGQPPIDPKQPTAGQKWFRLVVGRKDRDSSAASVLEAALERFRKDLERGEAGAVRQMEDALEVAEASIREKLEALVERMEQAAAASEPISDAWLFQETRYRALLDQVEASLAILAREQAAPLGARQREAVTAATDHTETVSRAALGDIPEGVSVNWNRLPLETLESFVGYSSDGSPLRELLDELGPDASKQVRDSLLRGIAEGKNPRQIARYAEDALGGNRNRALTIARTEVNRAARAATIRNYQENRDTVSGWIWLAALGTRTCAACWAMHGTEHSYSETLDDHPNGRCVAAPKVKSLAEIVGDPDIPDTRPVIEPGPAQFAKLSKADQEEILGPGVYALFQAGKIDLSHMVVQTRDPRWGTMRRPATLAEAQANAGVN